MKNLGLVLVFWIVCLNSASGEENASNPLASVNNTDFRWQGFSSAAGRRNDYYIDGSYMITPKLKLKYELHYNDNDFTGKTQSGFEKVGVKAIAFPSQTLLNQSWGAKSAIGLEWVLDLGDRKKAIGIGADQLAPLVGIALSHIPSGLTVIPLVQHFTSYNGPAVNSTAARLIALQSFGDGYWAKADIKVPYDWVNTNWPATAEVQLGYNFNKTTAVYVDGLMGIGSARPYDAGLGIGLRFKY